MTRALKLMTVLCLLLPAGETAARDWGPWPTNAAPVLPPADQESVPASREPALHSVAATPFIWLLRLYQKHITHVDGDRCPMYPTCSQYSVLAIRRHGPILGIIMSADRLMHEPDEREYVPLMKVGNRYRYIDPLDNNDFWWYRP